MSITDITEEFVNERVALAIEKHHAGYNCAQAVACALCDLYGADEDAVFCVSEGFGAGMGSMQNVCGAVSGALILAGLKNSGGKDAEPRTKSATYGLSKAMTAEFAKLNGTLICSELKGIKTGKPLRSCDGCIEDAVRIALSVLGK